jgi:hypothetical protein
VARPQPPASSRRSSGTFDIGKSKVARGPQASSHPPSVAVPQRVPVRPRPHTGADGLAKPSAATPPPHAAWFRDQVDALTRQQQRILHRTQLVEYVLVMEQRHGATLALADALTELLADISEAARTSATILQQAARPIGTPA